MRVVICGGRDYVLTVGDAKWLDGMRASLPITEVLHGDATGADAGAKKWAIARGVPHRPFPAKWDDIDAPGAVIRERRDGRKYNVLAGYWRNEDMAKAADICIAFPGGNGTADMMKRAEAHGLLVLTRPRH